MLEPAGRFAGNGRPFCWNRLTDLLRTLEHASTAATCYNDGHDGSWIRQANLLEPADRLLHTAEHAGTTAQRKLELATAAAAIHHCWNQRFVFCYDPATTIHGFAGNGKCFCRNHVSFLAGSMIFVLLESFHCSCQTHAIFVFCWKHTLFLLETMANRRRGRPTTGDGD